MLAIDAGQGEGRQDPLPDLADRGDSLLDDFRGTRRPAEDAREDESPLGRVLDAAVDRIEDRIKERVHDAVENVLTPGQADPGRPSESPSSTSDPDRSGGENQPLAPLIGGISHLLSNKADRQAEHQA